MGTGVRAYAVDVTGLNAEIVRLRRLLASAIRRENAAAARTAVVSGELLKVVLEFEAYQENSRLANRVVAAVVRWRTGQLEGPERGEYARGRDAVLRAADKFMGGGEGTSREE